MFLKTRLMGENPLKIDFFFQRIQQFGGIARQGGGVCAGEMALWDIAGKVYNCPVYQMLGGQWRDKVRIYADTTESEDPKEYGRRARTKGDGHHLDEDGSGHQRPRRDARYGDAARWPEQVGTA
jgi:L-alanine-DL-glutamate epimerase-like enolase superfamily enzyme